MRLFRWIALTVLLAALLPGCATPLQISQVDWNARIGHYTYNQAVLDLGAPDKMVVLGDGTKVGEWIIYRASPYYASPSFADKFSGGPARERPEMDYGYPLGPKDSRWLQLTFGPDGQLRSWRSVRR